MIYVVVDIRDYPKIEKDLFFTDEKLAEIFRTFCVGYYECSDFLFEVKELKEGAELKNWI